jgi:hypothetical protein
MGVADFRLLPEQLAGGHNFIGHCASTAGAGGVQGCCVKT